MHEGKREQCEGRKEGGKKEVFGQEWRGGKEAGTFRRCTPNAVKGRMSGGKVQGFYGFRGGEAYGSRQQRLN